MEDLIKVQKNEGFFKYPNVNFDATTGHCMLSGESFMEDSKTYYTEIISWLHEFHETEQSKTLTFIIKLSYFNTSSSKMLYELLKVLEGFKTNGQTVVINWHYDSNDSELEDDVADLCFDVSIDVNQIPE